MSRDLDDLYVRLAAIDRRLKHIESLERPNSANMLLWTSPAVLCVSASSQTINNNTETAITFDAADVFDTDNMHNPSSNPSRITIQTAGAYLFIGSGTWASGSGSGTRQLWLRVDGTTTVTGSFVLFRQTVSGDAPGMITVGVAALEKDQYVEMCAYQDSGSKCTLSAQSLAAFRLPGA